MRQKLLYIMNIDWFWIKQRPQFIAEELAKYYDVTVLYQRGNNRKGFQKKEDEKQVAHLKIRPLYVIPFAKRLGLTKLNLFNHRRKIAKQIKQQQPTLVFLTHPDQIAFIPTDYSGKIVYDCMDDHAAFGGNRDRHDEVVRLEQQAVNRAALVFASSLSLKGILSTRYGISELKIRLVRNGFSGEIMADKEEKTKNNNHFVIGYFGTISEWFNFDFLERSLKEFKDLNYILMGPVSNKITIPENKRINYIGTIEHQDLYQEISDCDGLMMPFKLNELIRSVDPVKLYEYINFQKNILCIKYPEVERFDKFVYFYQDYDSFRAGINAIISADRLKYSSASRIDFLQDCSWHHRAKQMVDAMLSID